MMLVSPVRLSATFRHGRRNPARGWLTGHRFCPTLRLDNNSEETSDVDRCWRLTVHRFLVRALTVLTLSGITLLPAAAQDFYRGKTINLIVGNAAGGGYDLYARLLARYMGRYIPGEPSFVVRNMPGAGGMVLTNHIYSQAPRDGLTLGLMARSNPIEPLLGNPSAKYRPEEFLWVGTPSSYEDDSYCIIIRTDSPIKSVADLKPGGKT